MKWMSLIVVSLWLMIGISYGAESVSGVIKTLKGKPIKNANILLESKNLSLKVKTNQEGKFLFKEVNSGKYFFSAEKKHMLTFAEPMMVNQRNKRPMEITLIPIEFAVFHYLPVQAAYF